MTSQVDGRFIGGTGRSGTSLLGDLLDVHPDVVYFHEPRFISDPGGLCDFVEGKVSAAEFEQKFLRYFRRFLVRGLKARGHETGQRYSRQNLNELLCGLSDKDRANSARWFVQKLFFGVWVEKTPHSICKVGMLRQIFPGLRYIHVIREPKDIWASIKTKGWGPRSARAFTVWYNEIMNTAWTERTKIPAAQYFVLSMERLAAKEKATIYQALYLLQIPDVANKFPMDKALSVVKNAHVGRWKRELNGEEITLIDRACQKQYRRWKRLEVR